MKYRLIQGDVLSFARHYYGDKFHAILCDPPYHLTSIVKRFGKDGSAPARFGTDGVYARASAGFMGKRWDGGDIAFHSDTWATLAEHLYPGSFIMAFASSRGWHRLAVAMEDAGLVIHPSIFGWLQGQGFPKATRIKGNDNFNGHRYGLQALKPALEPIIIAQKPYEGRPVENIVKTGAGAINVEGGRVGTADNLNGGSYSPGGKSGPMPGDERHGAALGMFAPGAKPNEEYRQPTGRWPANFVLGHTPACKRLGSKTVKGHTINRFTDGMKPFGEGAGHPYEVNEMEDDVVEEWECVENCPVRLLGEQNGQLQSGKPSGVRNTEGGYGKAFGSIAVTGIGDIGTASRFYFNADFSHEIAEQLASANPVMYVPKASRAERDAGLGSIEVKQRDPSRNTSQPSMNDGEGNPYNRGVIPVRNSHPTIKPIALCKWLATLLLPPDVYTPRRILVPFAGTGSEIIGALQAGWDCVIGIEKEAEYIAIGNARLDYWIGQNAQLELL